MTRRLRALVGVMTLLVNVGGVSFAQVGMVAPFISTYCPTGWVEPTTGTKIFSDTYPQLYGILHKTSTWGAGSQSGRAFEGLPGIGGNFIRGWSATSSTDTGRSFGSGQQDTIQSHKHDNGLYAPLHNGYYNEYWRYGNTGRTASIITPNVAWIRITQYTNWTGEPEYSRVATETRPVNVALLYCVKAVEDSVGVSTMSDVNIVSISTSAIQTFAPSSGGVSFYSFFFGVVLFAIFIFSMNMGRRA